MYFKECPLCGATLDPCEQCDCIEELKELKVIPTGRFDENGEWVKGELSYVC